MTLWKKAENYTSISGSFLSNLNRTANGQVICQLGRLSSFISTWPFTLARQVNYISGRFRHHNSLWQKITWVFHLKYSRWMNLSVFEMRQAPYEVKYIRTSACIKWHTVHIADISLYIRINNTICVKKNYMARSV